MIEYWWEIPLLVLVGIAEFILSWLNHRINIFVMTRKKIQATRYDLIANILSEVIPFFVYVYAQKWIFIVPRIIANTMGTYKAAARKLKPVATKKRLPKGITTA